MKFSRYIRLAIDIFDHNLRFDGGSNVNLRAMFMHDTANRQFRAPWIISLNFCSVKLEQKSQNITFLKIDDFYKFMDVQILLLN